MQILTAILTLGFSVIVAATATASGNDLSAAAGAVGIVAGVLLLFNAQVGFYALFAIIVVMGISVANEADPVTTLPFMAAYGVIAFLAYRVWQGQVRRDAERQQAAERAERADRYIRQQLGE
jgi:hypothetical protein